MAMVVVVVIMTIVIKEGNCGEVGEVVTGTYSRAHATPPLATDQQSLAPMSQERLSNLHKVTNLTLISTLTLTLN